jgi:polysaccharide pyruvyl transferase WcaK-like protein
MTIALLGLFGSPNLGNEATLAAFLHNMRIRLPHASFACVAPASYCVEAVHHIRHLPLDPLPAAQRFWRVGSRMLQDSLAAAHLLLTEPGRRQWATRMLSGSRALLVPGTGIFDDFGQGPLDMPLHLDRWTAAAVAVGARVGFVSVGATRVDSIVSRRLFARSLDRADYCSFRDHASIQAAQRMSGMRAASLTADLAFSLPDQLRRRAATASPPRTIGVGLMGYYGWNAKQEEGRNIYHAYIEKMATLVAKLLERRLHVRLLIGDTRADKDVRADVIRSVAMRGGSVVEGSLISAAISDYVDLIEEIERCDLVVATRFHNVLLSLWLNRPAISIGYDQKNDALMAEAGLARHCHSIERVDIDAVLAGVEELSCAGRSLTDVLASFGERQRGVLTSQYDELSLRLGLS